MMQLAGFEINEGCQWAQVSRAGFYRYFTEHAPKEADVGLRDVIQQIVLSNRLYGYRRVTRTLNDEKGFQVNHKRVLRLMREDNLLALRKRRNVFTTDSRHGFAVYTNLAGSLSLTRVNQLWVADLTYIRLRETFLYLAVVIDAYSRRVVGWQLDNHLRAELPLAALDRALLERPVEPGIVHHSDRGTQYCCDDYVARLRQNGFVISMSRTGNPYDNAKAESFMKTLKYEEVYMQQYRDAEHALQSIQLFIEEVYNRKRIHSSIGYLSPSVFEAAQHLPSAESGSSQVTV